jgi:hypothetical protein
MRLIAMLAMAAMLGCGSEGGEVELELPAPRSFEAGDLDPYGCPYLEPVPWVGALAHAQVCGPGCEPRAAFREAERVADFIACVTEDVPRYPYGVFNQVVVFLAHPVTEDTYSFANPAHAWPYYHLCWRVPGSGEPLPVYPSDCLRVPNACFEEPVEPVACE